MSEANVAYGQRRLENELVLLEPFDPKAHAPRFFEVLKADPNLSRYVPWPSSEEDFAAWPTLTVYVIYDKLTAPDGKDPHNNYAGVASINATSRADFIAELGIIVYPAFQRTHVASNAVGLMLLRTLDPPSAGGLGLRRVEWRAHPDNEASRRSALRMGFELEGILRWARVFPGGQTALPVDALERRNGTKDEPPGRHTAVFSIVWDEWEVKRPNVIAQMERQR